MAHGLGHVVHGGGRMETQRFEIDAGQHVEDLAQHNAAGARRRRAFHQVATVGAAHRGQDACPVGGKIGHREDAAAGIARAHDVAADRSAIEGVGALASDRLQRAGKRRLHQAVARAQWRAVGMVEQRAQPGCRVDPLAHLVEDRDVAGAEGEAVTREPDRGGEVGGARQMSPDRARGLEPGDRTGHAGREPAEQALAGDRVAGGVEAHAGRGAAGRLLAEIEELGAAVGEPQRHEAAAAEIACFRIDDGERVGGRDRGVDGIAALPHHSDARLGGEVLSGHHHAVRGLRRDRRPGPGRDGGERSAPHAA